MMASIEMELKQVTVNIVAFDSHSYTIWRKNNAARNTAFPLSIFERSFPFELLLRRWAQDCVNKYLQDA